MVRTRSVGTRIRPTCVSRPSILTFRANFSRTWSSLLLATRRTKNCIFGIRAKSGEGGLMQHFDQIEQVREKQINEEKEKRDQEHEDDDHFGRADDLAAAGPVDLLHLALGGDEEIDHFGLVEVVPGKA